MAKVLRKNRLVKNKSGKNIAAHQFSSLSGSGRVAYKTKQSLLPASTACARQLDAALGSR